MNFFTPVEDGFALLRSNGVFKQVPLFTRGDRLYAKWGSGFIGLMVFQQATTNPSVAWVELTHETSQDAKGCLTLHA